jgi:hypothetical protein
VPEWTGVRWRLRAEAEWRFTGDPVTQQQVWEDLRPFSQRLTADVLVRFGNAVGLFRTRDFGLLETFSGKLDSAAWEQMLREITEEAVALPFAAGGGAALPFDRCVAEQPDLLYHTFLYLRAILLADGADSLPAALAAVVREPHRQLLRTHQLTPLERVQGVDAQCLAAFLDRGHPQRAKGAAAASLLAQSLRGHLPEAMRQSVALSNLDTPENRFVRSFLEMSSGLIASMRRVVEARPSIGTALATTLLADCDAMDRRLAPYQAHALWREVGRMALLPFASPVLQQRRGYREVYRHFSRLRLAAQVPLSLEQMRFLLESKDIARLYELWAFFRVARVIRELLGPPGHAEGPTATEFEAHVRWGLRVAWNCGIELYYNPHFSRSSTGNRAYSLPLRPDIGLRVAQGVNAGWHLLDAKFRLEAGEASTAEGAGEERAYLREDLHKMHAYRDAIGDARTAWVLYPGNGSRFFGVEGGEVCDRQTLPKNGLEGVGAVSLLPGEDAGFLAALLAQLALSNVT